MTSRNDQKSCELAIKKTLAYRSIFKYPLSLYQLKTQLITKEEFKNKTIEKSLEHTLNKGYAKEKDKKYFLPGVKPVEWKSKISLTKKLIEKNWPVFNVIGQIPWVKMVAVTGSTAACNTTEKSDIDIFIISSKNRLWLTRGFVTILLKLLKKFPNEDGEGGKICTNLFMDEKELKWPDSKQNLHVAHDIILMQPIINKNDAYFRFMSANSWVIKYFAHFKIASAKDLNKPKIYKSFIVNFLENIGMRAQLWHMQKKKTTEVTTKHLIHFNKNDNSKRKART